MGGARVACVKLLPSILFVLWQNTFIVIGVYAMLEDRTLRDKPCGQQYHIWKYALMNIVFAFFTWVTYFVFPGGGEGARARAMVCIMFHFGFASWGILLWSKLSPACTHLLTTQYKTVFAFHHICVVTNLVFFGLLIIHEAYLGQKLGSDFTLMSEIHQHAPSYAYPGTMQGQFTSPLPHAPPGMTSFVQGSGQAPPPEQMPPPLADEYAKEYEEIMNAKTPPGHLPQGNP